MNTVVANQYSEYMIMQHQHMASGLEQRQVENQIQAEVQRAQQQQQEQQMHGPPPPHMQQPAPQYQPSTMGTGSNIPIGAEKKRYFKPHNVSRITQDRTKNNSVGKKQNNSPTHLKQDAAVTTASCIPAAAGLHQPSESVTEHSSKLKSPVKVSSTPTLAKLQF